MKVLVRVYASLRDVVGQTEVVKDNEEGASIKDLLREMCRDYGVTFESALFSDRSLNKLRQEMVILLNGLIPQGGLKARLSDNDVIAIFPASAGG